MRGKYGRGDIVRLSCKQKNKTNLSLKYFFLLKRNLRQQLKHESLLGFFLPSLSEQLPVPLMQPLNIELGSLSKNDFPPSKTCPGLAYPARAVSLTISFFQEAELLNLGKR